MVEIEENEIISNLSNGCPAFPERQHLKMIRSLQRSLSTLISVNAEEYELEAIELDVQNLQMPKFRWKELYHKGTFSYFKPQPYEEKYLRKIVEDSISLTDEEHLIPLFTPETIQHGIRESYRYNHIAAIPVAIKPLTRKNLGTKVFAIIQDCRHRFQAKPAWSNRVIAG